MGDLASVRGANRMRGMPLRGGPDFETADPLTCQLRYHSCLGECLREKPGMYDRDRHAANG